MVRTDICIIIPTYNNNKTITEVIKRTLPYTTNIIVVNDGSTDNTSYLLSEVASILTIISYKENRGKGYALKQGFRKAKSLGYRYAITMDADGQHFPEDIPLFVQAICQHEDAMIVGSRTLENENMPKKNSFANKFSNFWFYIQTGQKLPDTQTGFRLYPLRRMKGPDYLPAKYEAELMLLVLSSWHGIEIYPISINIYYAPKNERVTHFRPFTDFIRISILNTLLCICAVIYGFPLRLFRFIKKGLH